MSAKWSTLSNNTNATNSLTTNNVAANLLINGNGSALSNNTSTSTQTNQVNNSLYNNLSRGMKENFFIAAINQINQTTGKQAIIMNGLLQQQNQTQLTNNLVQQFNNSTTNSISNAAQLQPQQNTNENTANQQTFYQQQSQQQLASALRLKNLNNTALINNNSAMYRAFAGVNGSQQPATQNQQNCKQSAVNHQLINQSGVINNGANTVNSNTGILLNISNHNNHTNSHFNHYNQHTNNNQTYYNGYQLNYHLQNGQTVHHQYYHHSNSLSSSPRSSTSSNSSTSSSLINFNNTSNNLQNAKFNQQQQNGHLPLSSANSPTAINAPANQLNANNNQVQSKSQQSTNGHQNQQKIKNANNNSLNTNNNTIAAQQQQTNSSASSVQGQQQQQQQQAQNGNTSRYKTELCRPFEESGFCKYSDKCQYAHGLSELRSLQRHPKYKTELCRTFHSTGFCGYGPRCHFIHNNDGGNSTVICANKKENNQTDLFIDSFSSGSVTPPNNQTNTVVALQNSIQNGVTSSLINHQAKSSIESIEINSSGISSMGSPDSSPSTTPPSNFFKLSTANQSQQLKKNNKLQDLVLPLSPSLSIGSDNSSPLHQQLSSLSSKSDDVFYKYL